MDNVENEIRNPVSSDPPLKRASLTAHLTGRPVGTRVIAFVMQVPRLDDLVCRVLSENPLCIDELPQEYQQSVVDLWDPRTFDLLKYFGISNDAFWRRISQHRWPTDCLIEQHGHSWKRLFCERHLQEMIEQQGVSSQVSAYNSSVVQYGCLHLTFFFQRLVRHADACRPFVYCLRIRQLPSHLNLHELLVGFPNLMELRVRYGSLTTGMLYTKSQFGMHLNDALSMAQLIAASQSLMTLGLSDSCIGDDQIAVLCSGLAKSNSLATLDLSLNHITDTGCLTLCELLQQTDCLALRHLNLSNNRIRQSGAEAISRMLAHQRLPALSHLDVSSNAFGDDGTAGILQTLCISSSTGRESIETLRINHCLGRLRSAQSLLNLLQAVPERLQQLHVCGNRFFDANSAVTTKSNGALSMLSASAAVSHTLFVRAESETNPSAALSEPTVDPTAPSLGISDDDSNPIVESQPLAERVRSHHPSIHPIESHSNVTPFPGDSTALCTKLLDAAHRWNNQVQLRDLDLRLCALPALATLEQLMLERQRAAHEQYL